MLLSTGAEAIAKRPICEFKTPHFDFSASTYNFLGRETGPSGGKAGSHSEREPVHTIFGMAVFAHSNRLFRTNQQQQQQQKQQNARHEPVFEENAETSEKSYSATPPQAELNLSHQASTSHPPPIMISDPERQNLRPSRLDIETALDLYFKFCHRQPVWCFEHDEVSNYGTIPEDLVCSILALTSRFSEKRDQMQIWRKNAKRLIMFRIANGSVELTTIEALCLLSYSSFMGKRFPSKSKDLELTWP